MLPLQRFKAFISEHKLFKKTDRILLAVSGGKDSVLMLHLFKALEIDVAVMHCNFNLRSNEALRDENFVKSLCSSLLVPFYIKHFDTKKYASEKKMSTQMAARTLRYAWFEEIRMQEGFDFIAIAQHQNDAVETVLINLIRGTGIAGMHGILPKRDLLIRPLLFLNQVEIDDCIRTNGFDFVQDSSNFSTDYVRNKLRLQVLPVLKEINPNLERTFVKNIERFASLESFLNLEVERISDKILIHRGENLYMSIADISELNPQKLLLFELLKPFGFNGNVIEEILASLNAQTGTFFLSSTHQALINRDTLIISRLSASVSTNHHIYPTDFECIFNRYEIKVTYTDQKEYETVKQKAFVAEEELIFPLIVRNWQVGDKFKPLGMRNFKKVSDYFIDEKLPLVIKNTVPILVNGNGDIIWIVGMRQDNRFKLTNATKKVAIFEAKIV